METVWHFLKRLNRISLGLSNSTPRSHTEELKAQQTLTSEGTCAQSNTIHANRKAGTTHMSTGTADRPSAALRQNLSTCKRPNRLAQPAAWQASPSSCSGKRTVTGEHTTPRVRSHEISRQTDRMGVARSWQDRGLERTANRDRTSFCDENALKLGSGDGCTTCEYTEIHWII